MLASVCLLQLSHGFSRSVALATGLAVKAKKCVVPFTANNSGQHHWQEHMYKWISRTLLISSRNGSVAISTALYNNRALPVLSFVAQPLPQSHSFSENIIGYYIANIIHLSYRAFPLPLFLNLDEVGGVNVRGVIGTVGRRL